MTLEDRPTPPPIRHATDRRKLRLTEREVSRRLSPEARRQARRLTSVTDRLELRARRRGDASPDVFMPRSPYLSLVQEALEQRLEQAASAAAPAAAAAAGGPEAADGTSVALGDQLFGRFGPDDFGWIKTVVEATLTTL